MNGLGRIPQNLNVYAYGLNNPLRYTDPSGCGPWSWFRENVWIPGVDDTDELDVGRTVKVVAGAALVLAPLPTKHIGAQLLISAVAADQITSGVMGTDSLVYKAGESICDGCGTGAEIGATLGAGTGPMIGAKLAERVPQATMNLPYAGSRAFANTVEVSPRSFAVTRPPVRTTMPGGYQGPASFGIEKQAWIDAQMAGANQARLDAQMQGLNAFDEVCKPIFDKADEIFGVDVLP
jgi:hypothetical protein